MEFEPGHWVTLGVAVLVFLGTVITVAATRGRTKADSTVAANKRMDDRMEAYTSRLERRFDAAQERANRSEERADELEERVKHLEDVQQASERREKLLYGYTATLRDFILAGKPPPPPAIPHELKDWYSSFETLDTGINR